MISWKDVAERLGGSSSLQVGIATAVLAPRLLPALGRGLRPAVKGVIKGYLGLAGRTRRAGATADAPRRRRPVAGSSGVETREG
jgi:hypothetical protein